MSPLRRATMLDLTDFYHQTELLAAARAATSPAATFPAATCAAYGGVAG